MNFGFNDVGAKQSQISVQTA